MPASAASEGLLGKKGLPPLKTGLF